MKKIIAIINQKGGVGKTATACNLAHCFALANKKTILVDIDPSANATNIFLKNIPDFTVKEFLLDKQVNTSLIYPAYQRENNVQNLYIIPSSIKLALLERELSSKPFRETLLNKKLRDQKMDKFDYILIDCPPTLSILTINAIFAADFVLIPINFSKHALDGVSDLFDLLGEIKEGHSYDIRLVKNQFDSRKKIINSFFTDKLKNLEENGLILKTIVCQDERINKSVIENLTVVSYENKSTAALNYVQLLNELEGLLNG